jgi:hypothetical protein
MGLTIGPKIITENLTLHFDSGNPLGWNNTDGEWHNFATNTVGGARNTTNITYNTGEDALFFPNDANSDCLTVEDINYVTGSSDQINNMTLEAWVKNSSAATTHTSDERIILSFDRSSVFRFGIGLDALIAPASDGLLCFSFTAGSGGTFTSFDIAAPNSPNLRDDAWHQVGVAFTSSQIDFFIDGEIIGTTTAAYGPISGQDTTETPRYGIIGNGSESTSVGSSIGPTSNFSGYIKSIKFYDGKTLTSDEIKRNYNAQKARYGL